MEDKNGPAEWKDLTITEIAQASASVGLFVASTLVVVKFFSTVARGIRKSRTARNTFNN